MVMRSATSREIVYIYEVFNKRKLLGVEITLVLIILVIRD